MHDGRLIGEATEEVANHTNEILGGLLNATFGNMVELILCFQGIRQGQIQLVQCTLMGSVLSNLLLVLGCSFFVGGLYHKVS
jgi:Ca2+:H+ antiporter